MSPSIIYNLLWFCIRQIIEGKGNGTCIGLAGRIEDLSTVLMETLPMVPDMLNRTLTCIAKTVNTDIPALTDISR